MGVLGIILDISAQLTVVFVSSSVLPKKEILFENLLNYFVRCSPILSKI